MKRIAVALTGIFCLIINLALAQSEWPLQHVDKTAGLSNSSINSIYMDNHEFVWFGTWDGLNRYDGDQVTVYKPIKDDPLSISNNVIRQIIEDKSSRLWIVTHDGINLYDRKLDKFHRYLDQVEDIPFLENNLKAIVSDDSSIYVTLTGWGIAKYAAADDRFVLLKSMDHPLKDIYDIGQEGAHLYALNHDDGLLAYHLQNQAAQPILEKPLGMGFHTMATLGDQLFFIYQNKPSKLTFVRLENGQVAAETELNTHHSQVTGIGSSYDGKRLHAGTNEGRLFEVNLSDDKEVTMRPWDQLIPTLHKKKLKVFSIHESNQDILWIGTDGDGVYKYLTKDRAFYSIGEGALSDGKLTNSIVRAVHIDEEQVIYLGTRSGGLNVINRQTGTTQAYDKSSGLSHNTVLAIDQDHRGNLWLGIDGEGLDMIEKETGRILHFPRDFTNAPENLNFGSVYEIIFDAYGDIWLGTSGYGVLYLDVEITPTGNYRLDDSYCILPDTESESGISMKSNIVYTILEEEPNILWFGTRNGGLYRYNTLIRDFTHYLSADNQGRSALSNNDILSLHLDTQNKLWVGTSGGLNKVNLSDFSVEQYNHSDGLANNTIHAILEDDQGKLWLSSNNGLFAFSPSSNTFKNFNWSDGLLNYEYTDGAFFKSKLDHRLYFGGTKGLDIIEPAKVDTSAAFPRLVLSDLLVSNMSVLPGDSSQILHSQIDLQEVISLDYDQNFLSLNFTSLDYWHKQRCSYRYFLEGFDEDWIEIGAQSNIDLTNIPPGKYTLNINNTNENGNWNPAARQLVIHIAPPFWATPTAYFTYILLALLAQIGLVLALRNRAKVKKTLEIQKLKQEQAETLQKYKLEFFTDITHEFRTPLTLILGPVVALMKQLKENSQLYPLTQTIYHNSLRLQKLIQELIQFRKVELGKEKLRIRPLDVTAFVEDVLGSFKDYALQKEIQLCYESTEQEITAYVDSDVLERIIINLVSNALKYTEHGGKVGLKITQAVGKVDFCIWDTGIGINANQLSQIFGRFTHLQGDRDEWDTNSAGIGLSLTKKLVQLHMGEIEVKSTPGEGSTFSFWLPTDKAAYEGKIAEPTDDAILKKLKEHVRVELYQKDNLDQEMINISLERFEHNLLVVDDNLQILRLLKDLLSKKYNVLLCTRGQEALNLLANQKIDLVISDVIMPEMNGFELCRSIKNKIESSHIPVILLTAKGEIEEQIEGLEAGADVYLPKPFHPDHLYANVKGLIDTREMLRQKFESHSPTEEDLPALGIGARDDDFFKSLHEYITQQMQNTQLDAQQLANHLGLSKTSLYKKVRTITGQTPHALINNYRLKKAAYLLTHSDYNVSEIIYKTGFNSRSYFYKSFHETFHCAPSAYHEHQESQY
ncbi:MAG: two-component regulator propeller domain-containing protein [Cyclobacteriaceae bacterium]